MREANLADELQVWGFENDFAVFLDGSMGFGLKLKALDVTCSSDSQIESLSERLSSFLNSLAPGTQMQFVQQIGPGNLEIIEKAEGLRSEDTQKAILELHEERIRNLKEQEENNLIPKQNLYCFVRRKPEKPLLQKEKAFWKKPKHFEMSEASLKKEIHLTENLKKEVLFYLSSLGLSGVCLSTSEIAQLLYKQWNPGRGVELSSFNAEDIRSSILFSDVERTPRGFWLGGLYHQVISLKNLPDQTYASMARALKGLPFGTTLFFSLSVPNQEKELEKLQHQRRIAFSMARGKQSGVSDVESEAKLQDVEDLIAEMVAQGEKIFFLSLSVLVSGRNEEEVEDEASQVLLKIRELSGAEGMVESYASFEVFLENSIPNATSRTRSRRVKTSNASDLLPLFGVWEGHEIPRILLKNAQGGLFSVDPFSLDLSNHNQIITGGSGSGKSFLTNLLLLQLLKENPKVFIVDIGGSYQKLCSHLDGQYLSFNLTSDFALNPFDLGPGETGPSSQKLKFLVGLIEMMTKEDTDNHLDKLQRAELESAIQKLFETSPNPSISYLKALLLEHSDPGIKRLGKVLGPWAGNTPYGKVVDRPTTVSLDKRLVCFDLKGLEAYPDLQAVCLYLITDLVWREVQKDRSEMKVLVLDESWKLIESDAGASFVGEVFRTFRKYFASAIAISQNLDDFAKSRIAGAILPNTSLKWILAQKGGSRSRLKEVLQLNDNELSLIESLHQVHGSYSQAFLISEDKHALVNIEPTPLEYWLSTSDPRDVTLFEDRTQGSPWKTSLQVLKELSCEFPFGAVASGGVQ
jgi:conjugal transfer ATP-binding protein TraC